MRHERRWARWRADDGSASLEFISLGVLLLVPMVYLVLAIAAVQAGALAVEGAARQAARVYVQAPTQADAEQRAARAIEFALADYGLDESAARVDIRCSPDPARCLERNATVTVTVRARVALPLVPAVLDLDTAASVPVEATAAERVSRFRVAP
ncbi:hypothetical protein OSC27_06885 [Microbacterium sp. STN6]|uniref:hypothetical protein n=1 Tax=Microbacterium sp. STN6 TaxID=2995588 RepID=UPI002260D520|nr:hypothetical protein [Microbacterium sp. STN6]MCX7522003.1 hypothetical protein [Microbacterium sp. STN6]